MELVVRNSQVRSVYLQGSLLHLDGLLRSKVKEALAVMILTNVASTDPEMDDCTAVMAVASVKNENPHCRCIVQLLQSQSKVI